MEISRRRLLHLAAGAAALPTWPLAASAEAYPSRPIKLVVPYSPGGVMDAVGRPWADRITSPLGTVIIENIGGSGGDAGAVAVARARPDGYTILLANSSIMVINPIAGTHVAYDPVRSFEPVSTIAHAAQAIVINPGLPVHTLKELAEYAKRNPGKLSYGTPGVGTLNHLIGEHFKLLIGVSDIVHVPYRGAGPAIADLIGGQIPIAVAAVNGQLLAFHRAGKLRILAVTSPQRLMGAPELPTVSEAGLPDLTSQATIWLFAPNGTASGIVDRISRASATALAEPQLRQLYVAAGVEPSSDASPQTAMRALHSEIAHWTPIIKQIGLRLD